MSIPLLAAGVQHVFWDAIQPYVWFLFYPAVFFSAWVDGRRGGFTATVLSLLLVWYCFIPPRFSFSLMHANAVYSMGAFAVMGVLLGEFHARLKASRRQTREAVAALQAANAHLEQRVAERTADLERANLDLRAGRERLHNLINGLGPDTFVGLLAPDGTLLEANEPFLAAAGIRLDQVQGRPFDETYWWSDLPESRAQLRAALAHAAAGTPARFDVPVRVAGNERAWIDFSLHPVKAESGAVVYLVPSGNVISERKQAEHALRENEARLRLSVRAANVGLWDWDLRTQQVVFSPEWKGQLGYADEEISNHFQEWQSRVHPEDLAPTLQKVQAYLANPVGRHVVEMRMRHKDGSYRWISASADLQRDEQGTPIRMLGCHVDVTERKEAELAQVRLNAELEQRVTERTAQLVAANRELEEFSYSVSHDLRAPLRAVDGFAQAVVEDFGPQLPAEGRRQLGVIRESAQRMGQLIDDLLTFSRLSRQPLRQEQVAVGPLVRACLTALASETAGRRVRLEVAELPACAGDPALLRQVWLNLLGNALKYTRRCEEAVVEVGARRDGDETVYFVRDNGCGFDPRYAAKLFGVFQRLHRAEDYEGTGVGLAIVQRVVHRHGGRVWADAAVDRGATFFFTLKPTPVS